MSRVQVTMVDKHVGRTVDEAFAGITAAVGTVSGMRVERPDPSTLVVVRRYLPLWAVVFALLFVVVFLLGLVFLFFRAEDRLTIIGRDVPGGGARFTVTGQTDGTTAEFLSGFLAPAP